MITPSLANDLSVLARGEATEPKRDRFKIPAITSIRYADPAAWLAACAADEAIGAVRDAITAARDRTGVIAIAAEGPVEAMAAMNEASRGGFSSPIRFPASNPGSLAGITAIAFGLRGPTMMLTMPPRRGAEVALVLARAWISRGQASHVVVTATIKGRARALILGSSGAGDRVDLDRDLGFVGEGA